MKANKSPETNTEVTPSKKKLKQALLPFKIINEASSVPVSPVTPDSRKRKLSATEAENVAKVNKISKENDVIDLVVLSDDSNDTKVPDKQKTPNPYVKLVDTAWKKKLQKTKTGKKRKNGKQIVKEVNENGSINSTDSCDDKKGKDEEDCEAMEVDEPANEEENEITGEKVSNETDNTLNNVQVSESIGLEDSNDSNIQSTKPADDNSILPNENESKNNNSNSENSKLTPSNSDNEDKASERGDGTDDEGDDEKKSDEEPVTPKRSSRVKANLEKNNNKDSSSKSNEPVTPKQNRSLSASKLDESLNESTTSNTTPKQLQKKMESAKKKEEREKERLEREKKKQLEKEERAKQKQEKDEQRRKEREEKEEAKRKEKEEKEEQRKKEKEEKEKQKEMERKVREEKEEQKKKEKEEKEEQKKKEREAKEEEKRKKQEALELEKQEQELKKKKAAEAFLNFFVPKQKVEKDQPTVGAVNNSMLSSFTLKSDMRLAPTIRVNFPEEKAEVLEKFIKEQNVEQTSLYLKKLKSGTSKPLSSGKTWPLTDKEDDDVILVEDELPPLDGALETVTCEPIIREKLRPKLFSFHENRRPPYWGTWRRKSNVVKPRRPFGQDEKQLDYEVDSDEEWEEEQEGESIDGSAAGSDDEQGPDEYEVDNEVFVPHGYLSDEEATLDEDDVLSLSPETQKARLKHLEDEFESEMKKPTEKLKPRLYGLLWETSDGGKPDNCVDAIWNYFGKLSMVMNDPTPFMQPSTDPEDQEKKKSKKKKVTEGDSPKAEKKKKKVEEKDKTKTENKKVVQDAKKNQPGINMFLAKIKQT